jgi:hypothetical protein
VSFIKYSSFNKSVEIYLLLVYNNKYKKGYL